MKGPFFEAGTSYVRRDWTGNYSPVYFKVHAINAEIPENPVAWGNNFYIDGRGDPYEVEDFQDLGDWEMGDWIAL